MIDTLNKILFSGNEKKEKDPQAFMKKKSDEIAVAIYQMRNEKDPLKATKMNIRILKGIYDFSDL